MLFLEQTGLYLSSGLAIDKALELIVDTIPKRRKIAVQRFKVDIESGGSFSKLFGMYVSNSTAVCGIVRQGELTGELAGACEAVKEMLERAEELSRKTLSAMIYPAVILVVSILMTLGLIRGVMPQIVPLLTGLNADLPLLTSIVMAISDLLEKYGILLAIGTLIMIVSLRIAYKKIITFRFYCHVLILRLPLIGSLVRLYWVSVFLRSCGNLLSTGVPLITSYSAAASAIGFLPLCEKISKNEQHLHGGISLSEVLSRSNKIFPPYVMALATAGEMSGNLGNSLVRAAEILDRDMGHSLKKLNSMVEPLLMICVGCIVGAVALSIMLPIYDISKVLQR